MQAYDDLPEAMKQRQSTALKAVHVYLSKYSPRSLGNLSDGQPQGAAAAGVHPLVRTHPDNGRKALYLNPVRIESIVGMEDDADAARLIGELMAHADAARNTSTAISGVLATW